MKSMSATFGVVALAALGVGGSVALPVASAAAQVPVIDTTNYAQNLLQAARALEQINNQVKSLQNEASMLQNMTKNLEKIDFPKLQQIRSAMGRIDQLMGAAQGIQFKVQGLDGQIETLFPGELQRALTANQQVAQARARLDAAMGAYRQSMTVQAQVAENVQEDAGVLSELAATSQSAAGALQVGQAANQLLALSVKQQLQLQNLMAAEFREAAVARARSAQAEADGRAGTRRFLGLDTGKSN